MKFLHASIYYIQRALESAILGSNKYQHVVQKLSRTYNGYRYRPPTAGSEAGRRIVFRRSFHALPSATGCPLRALPILSRAFPFGRKINRGGGGRCNGELTSVDSEQKDKTHPMNNGSPVAHYTGEGSRAVLYVKTWTAGRPSGR